MCGICKISHRIHLCGYYCLSHFRKWCRLETLQYSSCQRGYFPTYSPGLFTVKLSASQCPVVNCNMARTDLSEATLPQLCLGSGALKRRRVLAGVQADVPEQQESESFQCYTCRYSLPCSFYLACRVVWLVLLQVAFQDEVWAAPATQWAIATLMHILKELAAKKSQFETAILRGLFYSWELSI